MKRKSQNCTLTNSQTRNTILIIEWRHSMNKIELMLLMKFESPLIPLDRICEDYFGYKKNTAKQRAKSGTLPVPAFRLGKSQKLPWMIKVQDLAFFIEKNCEEARQEWVDTISHRSDRD